MTADYWRYGCYFRNPQKNLRFRFDSTTTAEGPGAAGSITFSAWGEQGRELIEALLAEVQRRNPAGGAAPVVQPGSRRHAAPRSPAATRPRGIR